MNAGRMHRRPGHRHWAEREAGHEVEVEHVEPDSESQNAALAAEAIETSMKTVGGRMLRV